MINDKIDIIDIIVGIVCGEFYNLDQLPNKFTLSSVCGITNSSCFIGFDVNKNVPNVIKSLPTYILERDVSITIHNNPTTFRIDGELQSNCDFWLTHDTEDSDKKNHNVRGSLILGDRYLNMIRYTKTTQMLKLDMHYKSHINKDDIVLVDYIYRDKYHSLRDVYNHFDGDDVVVFRGQMGAMGRGQGYIKNKYINEFGRNVGSSTDELKSKFKDGDFTPHVKGHECNFGGWGDELSITKYVDDIDSEYRIMFGGHHILMYKRDRINDGNYEKLSTTLEKDSYVVDLLDITCVFSDNQIMYIKSVIDMTGLPFGSIDVFTTTYGNLGIFEWSSEFGTIGIEPKETQQLMMYGLLQFIFSKFNYNEVNDNEK